MNQFLMAFGLVILISIVVGLGFLIRYRKSWFQKYKKKILAILLIILAFITGAAIFYSDIISSGGTTDLWYSASGLNAYFKTNTTTPFSNITMSSIYTRFNTTRFQVSAASRINITLMTINGSLTSVADGDLLLDFYADGSGSVTFNIGGFTASSQYQINKNGTLFDTKTANSTGFISFTNTVWGRPHFTVLYSGTVLHTFYVATTGSDSTGTGAIGSPFKTLRKAINASTTSDDVCIRGGTYNFSKVVVNRSGTLSDWYHIYNYPSETVIIQSNAVEMFDDNASIFIRGRSYVQISGLTIRNSRCYGITVRDSTSHHIKFDNLTIHNCSAAAIYVYKSGTAAHVQNVVVENCTCYDINNNIAGYNAQEGISFSGVDNFTIQHNYVYQCGKESIDMKSGSCNGTCHNNRVNTTPKIHNATWYTVIGIYASGSGTGNSGYVSNISIFNNVVWGNRTGICVSGETGATSENITIFNNIINLSCNDPTAGGNGIMFNNNADNSPIYDVDIYCNTVFSRYYYGNTFKSTESSSSYIHRVNFSNNIFCGYTYYYAYLGCSFATYEKSHNLYYRYNGTTRTYYSDGLNQFETSYVTGNPLFASVTSKNFHINATSPAVDAGTATLVPPVDFEGTIRPQRAGYDIGADECTSGAEWYVSTIGSDSNPGTLASPFKTLRKGINASATGDTIYMRGGNYDRPGFGTLKYIKVNRSHITISAYNSEKVVIDGKYYTLTGSYGMIQLFTAGTTYWNNITFYGINFSNCSHVGVFAHAYPGVGSNSNITFSHCDWYNITNNAIYIYSEESITTIPCQYWDINNCTFNYIQHNGTMTECITWMNVKNSIYANNTLKNFTKQGLSLSAGSTRNTIQFNYFENKYYFSLKLSGESAVNRNVSWNVIRNNYFTGYSKGTVANERALALNSEQNNNIIHNNSIYNNVFYISVMTGQSSYPIHILGATGKTGQRINHNTITYNTIFITGGTSTSKAIYIYAGPANCTGNIIANNILVTEQSGNQIIFGDLAKAQTNFTLKNNLYKYTSGTTLGAWFTDDSSEFETGAVSGDPDFGDNSTGDLSINSTSPAIGAASATYTIGHDYIGTVRPQDTNYDIGAYEYITGGIVPTVITNIPTGVNSTNTTLHGYLDNDYGYDASSAGFQYGITTGYGSTILSENSVFAAGTLTYKIYKYTASGLKIAESASYGTQINALAADDTYIYAGGNAGKILQVWKSNLTTKAQPATVFGGSIDTIAVNDTYVWLGTSTTQKIYQLWKSNLTTKISSANYGGIVKTITVDDSADWYDYNWPYSMKITIDHTKIEEVLTNFPVLVSFTDTDLSKAQSSGEDIVFTSADNLTKLNHEIEYWNDGTGQLIAWVNVTSISNTSDTVVWLYYGNPTCEDQQNVAGTWDGNYVMVNHMAGSSYVTTLDSTSNDNDPTGSIGTIYFQEPGKIGYAPVFGTDGLSYISFDSPVRSIFPMTVEVWVKPDNFHEGNYIMSTGVEGNAAGLTVDLDGYSGSHYVGFANITNNYYCAHNSGSASVGVWYYEAGRWTGQSSVQGKFNMNKTIFDGTPISSPTTAAGNLLIGTSVANEAYCLMGEVDEVRISNIVRSNAWINASYECQNNTSTFMTVGDERTLTGFIHAAGATTQQIYQYYPANLTKRASSANYGGTINGMVDDSENIYAVGSTTQKAFKYSKETLTKLAESASYGGDIYAIALYGDYIYFGGATTQKVYECWTSNLTKRAETPAYGGTIRTIKVDANWIYVGGITTQTVRQYSRADKTLHSESSSYGGSIYAMALETFLLSDDTAFSENPITLSAGTFYHFRAFVNISLGTGYGDDRIFLTQPEDATVFAAALISNTEIQLTWINGVGGDGLYVEYAINNTPSPWNVGSGTLVNATGFLTGTSFTHGSLSLNTQYYYKGWAFAKDGVYKSNNTNTAPFGGYVLDDTATPTSIYIRNDGLDYFVWKGVNTTAYYVHLNLTGFDEAAEYISILANNGSWVKYYGNHLGTNWTIHTFDVVRTYLTDAAGNQTIDVTLNPNINYSATRTVTLKKISNGYNYTGYTTDSATTLATIDSGLTPGLTTGYFLAKWDRTTFTWQYYIHGFTYNPTVTVQRYNVILSKINANQVWII